MKASKTILRSFFFILISVSICWSLDFNLTKTVNLNGNPAYANMAQLDSDPMKEVVCPPTQNGLIRAFDHDGTLLWTFQTGWYGDIDVADVNGDGFSEIGILSADRHFYYLDHNGNQLWNYTIRRLGHGKPHFCQLDADANLEIVCGEWDSNTNSANTAYTYALDPEQKKLLWEFSLADDCVPNVKDLDNDGLDEVIIYMRNEPTYAPHLILLESDGTKKWDVIEKAWGVVDAYDYNNDNYLDVVVNDNGLKILNYQNGQELYYNNSFGHFIGMGAFQAGSVIKLFTRDTNNIYCLSDKGSKLWSYPMPGGNTNPECRVFDADGDQTNEILVARTSGDLFMFLDEFGTELFKSQLPGGHSGQPRLPINLGDFSGDGVFDLVMGDGTSHLYFYEQTKVDTSNYRNWITLGHDYQRTSYSNTILHDELTVRLEIPIQGIQGFSTTPVIVGDTIYAGGLGNTIKAFEKNNGTELWSYSSSNYLSSADIWNDYLVTSTQNAVLVLNRHTGTLVRAILHSGVDNNDIAAIHDGIAYKSYVGSGVFAADLTTGNILWDRSVGGYCCNTPTVTKDGTKVLADNASNGQYYCFNASNGNILWTYSSGVSWGSGQPTVVNDKVYFTVGCTATPGDLICLDLNSGNVIWRVDIDPVTRHPSRIAIHDGKIYFGSEEAQCLFCYDTNGNKLWTVPVSAAVWSPVLSGNNRVVFPAANGNLYVIDSQTGIFIQTISLGFDSYSWSFALHDQEWFGYLKYGGSYFLTILGGHPTTIFTKITIGEIVSDGGTSQACSWGDYDNDGDQDLFVGNIGNNFLYSNNGDHTFTKITTGSIVTDGGHSPNASWGDYDNDGFLDLFIANNGNNFLYKNNGDGTFIKVTSGHIVNDGATSTGASWGDYDNDRYLDLFVANYGQNNFLYHNNGDGTFTRIISGNIVNDGGNSHFCVWGDYDKDGDLDLYVLNAGNNFLYQNNGDMTFTKILTGSIVTDTDYTIGGTWCDYDNDGDLDMFVTNYFQNNCLYQNNGNGTFAKITSGIIVTDPGKSEGSCWGDFDNDGDIDLYVTNENQKDFLYRNNGDGTFSKITNEELVNHEDWTYGCAWCDYDVDGDLDIFVTNTAGNNFLYENNGNGNNWINIKCVGTISNTSAIGALVRTKALINGNHRWQMQQISGQTGGYSQNSLNVEFGLGDATVIDSFVVEWPSGIVQVLTNVAVNQFLTIIEQAQVQLWIDKNLTASTGEVVTIPVKCSDVTDLNIFSAGLTISYDASILEAIDANLTGTIAGAAGWGPPVKGITPGQIQIGMAGTTPLSGKGALVNILCKVKGSNGDSTYLHFKNAILNEGDPSASISDGLLRIVGYDMKGKLYYYSTPTVAVKDAKVLLTGDSTGHCISDANGIYEFLNLSSGNYTVTPQKTGDQRSAITAYDASYILRHYVGLLNLTPYQKIAADVSGNGQITPYDASYILRYCVGAIPQLPIGQDWTFVPHDYPITDTTWASCPRDRSYLPLNSPQLDQDFLGIVYGDVSGNWSGSNQSSSNVLTDLTIGDIQRIDNKKWLVPITIRCSGDAFSGTIKLSFNDSDLKFKSGSLASSSDEIMFAADGQNEQICFAFASAHVLNNQEIKVNLLFEELKAIIPSPSDFDFVDVTFDDKNTTLTIVENESTDEMPVDWQLSQNHPNPFNPETSIMYQVPKTSLVKIEVYNLLGQRIKTLVNEEKSPGTYQVLWNGRDDQDRLMGNGVYLYKMQAEDFSQVKQMILLK